MDNFDTHKAGAFYEAFSPEKAKALWDRFEFIFTPKHGSWLNMAEIELHKFSKEILEKYKGESEFALPAPSNQMMNEYVKIIGKRCGIDETVNLVSYKGGERVEETFKKWELLTTHCGRRTFVSNALFLNIHESVIMKWTGHSDPNTMKPYRKIMNKLTTREMGKFDKIDKIWASDRHPE
jgi:integrase